MKIKSFAIAVFFSTLPCLANAGVMFEFTVDAIGFSNGIQVGDTFFVSFVDDSNFSSGISAGDIESLGFNSAQIGSASWNVTLCNSCSTLSQFFAFTDLGEGNWQLDALVGQTGVDAAFFDAENNNQYLQLGQTISGSGSTSLAFGASLNNSASTHFAGFSDNGPSHTFTAYYYLNGGTAVPEPETLILLISGLGLLRRFGRRHG